MRSLIKFFILGLVFAIVAKISFGLNIEPTSWTEDVNSGDTKIKTFVFSIQEGSEELSLNATGDISDWVTISPNNIQLSNETKSKEITVLINVPDDVESGTYVGSISYSGTSSGSIPIILYVTGVSKECEIFPLTSTYIKKIQKGTTTTKKMSIMVSQNCKAPVRFKDIELIGDAIETNEGTKPVRIEEANLGYVNPGEEMNFNAVIDGVGVDSGVYDITATITALDPDNKIISTQIEFQITVTGESVTPETSEELPIPVYSIPSQAEVGKEFQIKVSNINANMEPQIFWNPDIVGVKVERTENEWVYTCYINKTGTFEIKVATFYKGGIIGSVYSKNIVITGSGTVPSSNKMKFEFYPSIDKLKDGDKVSILVRDSVSNNVINDAIVFLNGERLQNNSFIVHEGETYVLTASHPNYMSLDYNFTVNPPKLILSVINQEGLSDISVGDRVTVLAKNSKTMESVNLTYVFLDGNRVNNPFQVTSAGTHVISAESDCCVPSNITINVGEKIMIIQPATKSDGSVGIEKNKEATVILNKNATWRIDYFESKSAGVRPEIFASGSGKIIRFTPKKKGYYRLYANGVFLTEYELSKGSTGNLIKKLLLLIIIIGGFILLVRVIPKKKKRKFGFGYSGAIGGENAVEFVK